MIKSLLLGLALLASITTSSLANTITFFGDTTGMPVFNRPTETGARSGVGTAVPFFVYQIDVIAGGVFNFSLDAVNPATYDTFLHLYSGAFNPADTSDPALNFLAGNDDRNLLTTNSGLSIMLASANRYFFVIDGFGNSDFGAYTATISSANGLFTASAVPETESTVVFAGLALCILLILRRRLQGSAF